VLIKEQLIPKHGGYRKLKSVQVAQRVNDVTVRFCELYVDRFSRTRDQMVQAARSGVQNIAEGSQASATSKKTELKLTNVARASLEKLRLDYEDFLRQRALPLLAPDHPALLCFKRRRCTPLEAVQAWVAEEKANIDGPGRAHTKRGKGDDVSSVRVRVGLWVLQPLRSTQPFHS
jgi:four helix bundle protein